MSKVDIQPEKNRELKTAGASKVQTYQPDSIPDTVECVCLPLSIAGLGATNCAYLRRRCPALIEADSVADCSETLGRSLLNGQCKTDGWLERLSIQERKRAGEPRAEHPCKAFFWSALSLPLSLALRTLIVQTDRTNQ